MKTISEGTASAQEILRRVPEVSVTRRTEPTRRLFDPSSNQLRYTPAHKMVVRLSVAQFSQTRRV